MLLDREEGQEGTERRDGRRDEHVAHSILVRADGSLLDVEGESLDVGNVLEVGQSQPSDERLQRIN